MNPPPSTRKQNRLRKIFAERRVLLTAARKGDHKAELALAEAYRKGTLYSKNSERAVAHYRKAASSQNADMKSRLEARFQMAVMSMNNDGCQRDPRASAATFIWIARANHRRTNESLRFAADMYTAGTDISRNPTRALLFLDRLAGRGDAAYAAPRISSIKQSLAAEKVYNEGVTLFLDRHLPHGERLGTNLICRAAEMGYPAAIQDTQRILASQDDFRQIHDAQTLQRILVSTSPKDFWSKRKPEFD